MTNIDTTTQAPASNPVPATKPARKPRASKPKTPEKKAKATKATKPHKPSTIVRTDANPAKSIVPSKFKAAYAAHNDTNGSPLSLALKKATTMTNDEGRETLDVKALKAIAKAHGIDFTPYEGLNNGQKRMNVGNKLRGLVKAGKPVTIGGKAFKSESAVKAAVAA